MFGIEKYDNEFLTYVHTKNVTNLRLFSLAICAICMLLFIYDSGPTASVKYSTILNQSNIAVLFFSIFLIIWLILSFYKTNIKIQKIAVWVGVLSAYTISCSLSYLSMARGGGITGLSIAYLMIAVLFSTRIAYLIAMVFIVAGLFSYYVSLLETVSFSEFRTGLIAVVFLSILVSITMEKQRREVFNSRKKLEHKIAELNKALDVKATFFGHMSHELRTPLNAIIGFSDMLRTKELKPESEEKAQEYAEYIYSGGNHLLSLVNDLLDQNKI